MSAAGAKAIRRRRASVETVEGWIAQIEALPGQIRRAQQRAFWLGLTIGAVGGYLVGWLP